MGGQQAAAKSGALGMLQRLLSGLGMGMVPYLNLLMVPFMGLTSDPAPAVRAAATSAFAAAVALLPLSQVRLETASFKQEAGMRYCHGPRIRYMQTEKVLIVDAFLA